MALLTVERIGGLAGFGGPGARIRSHGVIEFASVSEADRRALEKLFATRRETLPPALPDAFVYRVSRTTPAGTETIEVAEAMLPAAIIGCVKDELA